MSSPRVVRTSWLLLVLPLAVAAGAAGGALSVQLAAQAPAPELLEPSPTNARADDAFESATRVEIARLENEVDGLRREIKRLEAGESRAPAFAPGAVQTAAAETSEAVFLAEHRQAILKLIADERTAEVRRREDERGQREVEALNARAQRAAQQLGLDPVKEKALAQLYLQEHAKLEELIGAARAEGRHADPEQAREAYESVKTWRARELDLVFGPELARQIVAFEQERVRGQRGRGGNRSNGGPRAGGRGDG